MTVGPARFRWATPALIVVLLVACGGSPTSGPDLAAPVVDLADLPGAMAAAEIAARQDDRERAGLVNLGPGSVELAAAMDASAGRALTSSQSRPKVVANGFARPTRIDGIARPEAAGRVSAPEPGVNAMVVWAVLITSLDDIAKGQTQNGTVEDKPESVSIGGNTGTVTTTVTLRASASGGRLSVDLTMKSKGQVVDKVTGAILYGIDSIASGHVEVDFCPDASGHSAVTVKLTSSEIYTQACGSAKGVSKEFSGTATIAVNDDAKISKVEGAAQASEDAKGGVPPAGGGESGLTASTRTASDSIANDGAGRRVAGAARDIKLGGSGSTSEQQGKLWGSMTLFVDTMVTAAAAEAEKLWREGGCIEVLVDPEGGDVSPDEVTQITAKVKHKIDGNELDKPVAGTLTGVKTLEPAGGKQPAPADLTYTAGPNQGDIGRIHFISVSNRGIGEKDVTFTVGSAKLRVSLTGKMTSSVAGISFSTTVAAPAVVLTRQGDGTYTGSGPVTVGIDIGLCPPFSEKGSLKLIATPEAGDDPSSPARLSVAYDPRGQVAFTGRCVVEGAEVPLESFTGSDGPTIGFMFVLGDVVFDATGGTRQIKSTKSVGASRNTIDAVMKMVVEKAKK